jgi:hypothetical protein
VASWLVSGYLLVASMFGVNVNELFSAQGIFDEKCLLRMHIDHTGTLTIYPVAVERVGRRWRATPNAASDKPWIEPAQPLTVDLVEPPIMLQS